MSEKLQVARLTFDGRYCVFDSLEALQAEIKEFFENSSCDEITIRFEEMTRAEFDALPEFEGW